MGSSNEALRVESGAIIVLRLYDVAYAIDLARVEELAAAPVSRLRLTRAEAKAISFGVAPLEFSLGPIVLPIGTQPTAEAVVRVYEFGAIAISLRIAVQSTAWQEYVTLVNATYKWAGSEGGSRLFSEIMERVQRQISPA